MMRSLMFSFVSYMNEAFGNKRGNPADLTSTLPAVSGNAWARLENQCKNIAGTSPHLNGEVKELFDAIYAQDVDKTRDALGDIVVFALGGYHIMGYDADADVNAILVGVMTRFSKNEDELDATLAKWALLGVTDVRCEGKFPAVCVKTNTPVTTSQGEFIPANKFLKSASYKEPVFAPAPEPADEAHPARRFFGMPTK